MASTTAIDRRRSMGTKNRPGGPEFRCLLALTPCGAAAEALHPVTGVHELLLARVEGVAVRADLDVQLGLRGPGPELVAAGAAHVSGYVLGVDSLLHRPFDSTYRLPVIRRSQARKRPQPRRTPRKRAGSGCLALTRAIHSSSGMLPSISRDRAEITGASSPARSIACASRRTVSSASTACPTFSGISSAGTPSASSSPALRLRDFGPSAVATRS